MAVSKWQCHSLCSHTSLQFISHASASMVSFRAPKRLPTACKVYPKFPCYLSHFSISSFLSLTKLLTELCSTVFYCVPSHQADFCLRIRCSLPHRSSSLLGAPLYHCPMYLAVPLLLRTLLKICLLRGPSLSPGHLRRDVVTVCHFRWFPAHASGFLKCNK